MCWIYWALHLLCRSDWWNTHFHSDTTWRWASLCQPQRGAQFEYFGNMWCGYEVHICGRKIPWFHKWCIHMVKLPPWADSWKWWPGRWLAVRGQRVSDIMMIKIEMCVYFFIIWQETLCISLVWHYGLYDTFYIQIWSGQAPTYTYIWSPNPTREGLQ